MRTMVLVGLLLVGSVALAQDCDLYREIARDAMAYKQSGVEPDDAVRRLMVRFDDEHFDLVNWIVIETRNAPEVSPGEWGAAMREGCLERKAGESDQERGQNTLTHLNQVNTPRLGSPSGALTKH